MNVWKRVIAFVEQREDATSLALCRIVLCATVFGHIAYESWLGAAQFAWTHESFGGLGVHEGALFSLLGGTTPTNVAIACVVCAVAALFGALGLFTRPSLVVMWLLWRALVEIPVDARAAYDVLVSNIAFVLLLSGCGRALSLDALIARARARRRGLDAHAAAQVAQVARWPRIALVAQIGFLYFGTALMKASSGWVPGGDASALWYILHQPLWTRSSSDWPLWLYPFTQVATTCVWLFEVLGLVFVASVIVHEAPPASRLRTSLFGRALERVRFRSAYLLFGVAMHLGIEATMEVGAFTGASLSLYACALMPSEARALLLKCSPWSRSKTRSPS